MDKVTPEASDLEGQMAARRSAVKALRERGVNPYANDFRVTHAIFALPVYLQPVADATGWSRAGISTAMTIGFIVMGIGGFGWGTLSDRIGARPVVLMAAVLLGAGLIISSQATNLLVFQIAYGGLACGSVGAFFAPLIAATVGWFDKNRSLAVSLVSLGGGAVMAYQMARATSGETGAAGVGAGLGGVASAGMSAARRAAESWGQGLWSDATSRAKGGGEATFRATGGRRTGHSGPKDDSGPAGGHVGGTSPAWARRIQSEGGRRAHAHTTAQAIKDGDRPAAAANPDLGQKEA